MPSPFPGMDPYLEHPLFFPGLHDRFITGISDDLQPRLPAPYFAEINERLWVETAERSIEPDTHVLWTARPGRQEESNGEVAVATATEVTTGIQPAVIPLQVDERRETCLEIRTKNPDGSERVVTAMEVLSLTNKTPGDRGRQKYLQKRDEVLTSQINLLEIDLLRGGIHSTIAPRSEIVRRTGLFDYHICIHLFDRFEEALVYTIRLPERLPVIAVPLLPGDGTVPLDLQAVFNRCYDTGPYRRRVHYDDFSLLTPPLHPDVLEWVKKKLHEQQLLPATPG